MRYHTPADWTCRVVISKVVPRLFDPRHMHGPLSVFLVFRMISVLFLFMNRAPETDNPWARRHVIVGSGYAMTSHFSLVSCPSLLTVVEGKTEPNLGGPAKN